MENKYLLSEWSQLNNSKSKSSVVLIRDNRALPLTGLYSTAEQLEALRNRMMHMHKRLSTNLTYLAKLADRQVLATRNFDVDQFTQMFPSPG